MAASPVIVLPFSLYPFNLFILAVHTVRTVLLYSNCTLSIIKACFPWLLWCWNGTRGPIHIRPEVPSPLPPPPPPTTHTSMHAYFCANSRIPIYILAVDLNYCKHLCGPARHNRLAGSCIISVPPTGTKTELQNYWFVVHMTSGAATNTVEYFALLRFIAKVLEYLLNESLKTVKSVHQNRN